MALLEPNDSFQDRGLVKLTDGTYTSEFDSNSNLKVAIDPAAYDHMDITEVKNALQNLLREQKLTNAYLKIISGNDIAEIQEEI